jgi:hypothetical protein
MSRLVSSLLATVAVLALTCAASAIWSDNFDSYAPGSINGQGGWKGWDNTPAAAGIVTPDIFLSPPHSQEITGPADSVREYSGYTSGLLEYNTMMFIPEDFTGETYFIMLNIYNDGGPYNWSIQHRFNSTDGKVYDDMGGGTWLPLITGRWVLLRNVIDLNNDVRTSFYDGQLLGTSAWKTGDESVLDVAAVDLFANGASPVYYDDMELIPEPGTIAVLAVGVGALLLRRRR